MKLKKQRKSKLMHGRGMGTHGWGARKKHMGSGHRGGFGMAGTGKRADQKKSLIIKKYERYFGKAGYTSKPTERKKNNVMNLEYISKNIESLKKKYLSKEGFLDLSKYKILGKGEIIGFDIKEIRVQGVSESAKKKLENAGCKVNVIEVKDVKQYLRKESKVKKQEKDGKKRKENDTEVENEGETQEA